MASTKTPTPTPAEHEAIPLRPITLRDVFKDCGGPSTVAEQLGVAITTVYDWQRKGRVPDSDLKDADQGGTAYSDSIAKIQRSGSLSPRDIRRLGRRL